MPTIEQPTTAITAVSKLSELDSLKTTKAGLERNQSGWEAALSIALLVTALAAFLVFVFDWRVRKSSKAIQDVQDEIIRAKDDELTINLKAKDVEIGALGKTTADANERATKAQGSLAVAEQHSAEANAKAEGFRLDIAQANARAAEANRIAEQERLARLQLEARLADRILLPIQEQNLERTFAKLRGKTVDVTTLGDTMEIAQFSGKIIDCLRRSGVLLNISRPLGGASARGVLVGVKADAPPEFKQSADAFIAILRQTVGEGVGHWDFEKLVSGGPVTFSSDKGAEPNSPLRIWIGSK